MKTKTYRAKLQFKQDGEPGSFRGVFATLNVIDLDDDVTVPGAFGEQKVLLEGWNHNYDSPPVGRGRIFEEGNDAIVEGQFFLDTQAGEEHYLIARKLQDMQEFSYTFYIEKADRGQFEGQDVRFLRGLDVVGIAQVSRGAGVDTRLLDIKAQKRAIGSHSTPTSDAAWDGPANEARLRTDESAMYYRRAYAWVNPEADPETKTAYKFIHHMVGADGNIGAANVRACITGIAVLNGGRGGSTIPDADRQGVYNHLARHLRDADVEPPDLKSFDQPDESEGEIDSDKPSVVGTDVIRAQLDILELEE